MYVSCRKQNKNIQTKQNCTLKKSLVFKPCVCVCVCVCVSVCVRENHMNV